MPKRAAYALAGRSGEMGKKIEIIQEYHNSRPDEIIQVIQEAFPLKKGDKRKSSQNATDADLLRIIIPKIKKVKGRKNLEKLLEVIEKLLSLPVDIEGRHAQE